uniref:hypothetical protein n=1 Tax=Candidatus Scatomorpha intestinigallinarum TaxID=2840923 RepID=UPI00402732BE
MKKIAVMLLCALLALSTAACGQAGTEAPAESAAAQTAADETPAAAEPAVTETPAADEAAGDASLLDTAKQFEGEPLEDLIAAVGEPESSDYAPSCLGDGEDGNLYYDGFTVYTYRDDSGEIVNYVE